MAKFDESRILIDEGTGYSYVKVNPKEVIDWGGFCICNSCNNQFLGEDLNLCFVAGDTYCDKCFNDMRKRWKRSLSREDIEYDLALQDDQSLDWYKYHLDSDYRNKIIRQNTIIQNTNKDYISKILNKFEDIDFDNLLKEVMSDNNEK